MPAINAYHGGRVPDLGDYVRSVHPTGPRHALTVVGILSSSLMVIEDVTGRIRMIPARKLDLIRRADLTETPAAVRRRVAA